MLRSVHEGTFSPYTKAGLTQVNFGLMQSITADLEARISYVAEVPVLSLVVTLVAFVVMWEVSGKSEL